MAITIRRTTDEYLEKIKERLAQYEAEHPQAAIDLYRQNPASVRIRIVDPDFAPMDRVERDNLVWRFLTGLDDSILWHITMLLLLTPEETEQSFANREFEHPTRSGL